MAGGVDKGTKPALANAVTPRARSKIRRSRAPNGKGATAATSNAPRPKAAAPTQDETLDLDPKGKTSFSDFITKKSPPEQPARP